jgi:hypothetical protein
VRPDGQAHLPPANDIVISTARLDKPQGDAAIGPIVVLVDKAEYGMLW